MGDIVSVTKYRTWVQFWGTNTNSAAFNGLNYDVLLWMKYCGDYNHLLFCLLVTRVTHNSQKYILFVCLFIYTINTTHHFTRTLPVDSHSTTCAKRNFHPNQIVLIGRWIFVSMEMSTRPLFCSVYLKW